MHVNAGSAAPIQLQFTTVGALHQGFFAQAKGVQKLGKALGACTDHTVDVQVVWSQKDLEGRIVGQVPSGTTVCEPVVSGTTVDLRPVVPATHGLAAYRDRVAGMSDFRIANFVVGVDLRGGAAVCRLKVAGQHPPDGTRFHPCVEINGERVCAQGDPSEGVEQLVFDDPRALRAFKRCL